jgi:protein TonB
MKKTILGLIIFTACHTSSGLLSSRELKKHNYQEVAGFYDDSDQQGERPDKLPMYPDGLTGLMKDINAKIRYPANERENNIQGVVVLKYIIEKDGTIQEIIIEKSVSDGLNNEAISVLKKLKRWHPGFKYGKPVRVSFHQPFNFRLE